MLIRPVVMQVPAAQTALDGERQAEDLSLRARDAVAMSALSCGQPVPAFEFDAEGWPVAGRGTHWSTSKVATMVAGVTSVDRVGIAVEKIDPQVETQVPGVLSNEELEVLGGDAAHAYFCALVAKIVILEQTRAGREGLARARVTRAWSDHALVDFDGTEYPVSFGFFSGHVAAVTGRSELVDWRFVGENMPKHFSGPSDHAVFI